MTSKRLDIKGYLPSLCLTIGCIIVLIAGADLAVSQDYPLGAFTYHFSHANIFHLLCNLIALFPFKPRWTTTIVAYLCATLSALLLSFLIPGYGPICGLSALIFASFARRYAMWHLKVWKIILFNLPFIFIPQVDGLLHLVSFFTSYLIWRAVAIYREKRP